jgi:hypothetical protein
MWTDIVHLLEQVFDAFVRRFCFLLFGLLFFFFSMGPM